MKPIVLVTGGRDYHDRVAVARALAALDPGLIIEGGARGADTLARLWAESEGVHVMHCEARWNAYGKRAGPVRNGVMVRTAALLKAGGADVRVVAFPGGTGTADCIAQATAAGLPVHIITPTPAAIAPSMETK
jgi:hypothetical protein